MMDTYDPENPQMSSSGAVLHSHSRRSSNSASHTYISSSSTRQDAPDPAPRSRSHTTAQSSFDHLDSDPDAFYRTYSTQSTDLPDIFIHDEHHIMPPKRKPVGAAATAAVNASAGRSLTAATATSSRGASRSVSSPVSSVSGQPNSTAPGRTSIKDRVKQLEQANSGERRTPSGPHTSKSTSRLQKPPSRDKPQNDASPPTQRKQVKDGSGRQPLFGEVTGAPGIGYGIPSLTKQRSNLETSMPASRTSSRSHTSSHQRSSSDETEIEVDGSSVAAAPEVLSPSRIPVPRPRRASDYGLAANARPRTPTRTSSPRNNRNAASKTPGSSNRRYSPRRHAENNTSLTAVVTEPLPKLSPPLRSSRPRQPVSSASTAASRAKVSDRFTTTITQQPKSRSAPKDFPRVDVASRRDAVQTHLARTYVDAKSNSTTSTRTATTTPKSVDSPLFPGAFPESPSDYFDQNEPGEPAESTSDAHYAPPKRSSPVAARSRDSDELPDFAVNETIEEDGTSVKELEVQEPEPKIASDDPAFKKSTLSKNVWILRQDSPTTSEPKSPEDMLSDIGDGETINIVLGSTPILPQSNFEAPEPSPIPEIDEDSFHFQNGRSSIYPDDSVSVVFQQHSQPDDRNAGIPPLPALPKLQTNDINTIDSAGRSQINRVLEQYQQQKAAPQLSQPYEDYISQLTPSMAAHAHFAHSGSTSPLNRTPSYNTLFDAEADKPFEQQASNDETEEPSGTAIIFTNKHSDKVDSHASKSTTRPTITTRIEPSDHDASTVMAEDYSRQPRRTSHSSQRQSDDFGYAYVSSTPQSAVPPSPAPPNHAPPPPPPPTSNPHTSRKEVESLSRKESLGVGTSPIPRTRMRKDTYDTDGSSLHRASRTSRPDTLSSATRKSIDTASSVKSGNVSRAERDLKQRWHIIKELVDTEHKFVYDMIILVDIFMATSNSVPSLAADDRRCIFGNAEKVREASSKFLDALKRSSSPVYQIPSELRYQPNRASADTNRTGESGKAASAAGSMPDRDAHSVQDRKTTIGATFLAHADELDKVYRSYMINHTSMTKKRLAIMADKKVKMWLDECVAAAKDMSGIWSLDSMTIKPTQRYLKYHLLLRQILEHTPLDHPDYNDIQKALEIFTSASQSINDNARKREITGTLLTESKIKPKKISFRDLIMARSKNGKQRSGSTGTGAIAYDPQYDPNDNSYEAIRQRFGGHFFQLQIVMRDFEKYLDDKELHLKQIYTYAVNLKANYRCDLGYNRFPEWESRMHQFVELIESIQRHAWPAHQESVKKFVISPVRRLWKMHDNPQHLMFKHRKLKVSLQKYLAAKEKNDTKSQDRYRDEAKNWEVLNDVLINELPQLYAFTKQTVHACLKNFLDIEARWNVMWLNKLKHFCGDYDANMFFENDIDVFYAAVMDEFRRDTEEVDFQLANMLLAQPQGEGLESIGIGMPDPDGGHEPLSPAEYRTHRSNKSNSKRPANLETPYASNGSGEQARSTPNLNLGVANNHSSSNRLSDYRPDLPHHRSGLMGHHLASASGGPTTPTYNGPLSAGHQRHAHTPQEHESFSWRPIDSPSSRPDTSNYASYTTEERMQQYHQMEAVQRYHDSQQGSREPPRFTSALPGEWPVVLSKDDPKASGSAAATQSTSQAHSRTPSHAQQEGFSGNEEVLFCAASLFEFRIDASLRERGYPYLQYVAGDIFDVVKDDGELWLARNQDEPEILGWIWSRHAALLALDYVP